MKDGYGIAPLFYGVMVSLCSFSFIIPASLAGKLNGMIGAKSTMLLGMCVWCFGILFIGPSPLLPFLPQPDPGGTFVWWAAWCPVLAFVSVICGFAFLIVTISPAATDYAVAAGWALSDASAQNAQLLVLGAGIAFGIGPLVGATLVQHFEVPVGCTIMGCFPFFYIALPLGLLALWERRAQSKCSSNGVTEALLA